ncbi:MAG: polysaccharide pyruvyl transferase family protein [Bacteroidota bacterium]
MKSNTSPNILILGMGSLRNYGCEGIVKGTYNLLQENWPGCQLTVASDDIEYDQNLFRDLNNINFINYKRRFSPYRIFKGLLRRIGIGNGSAVRMNTAISKNYDIFLSAGGDNYMQTPEGTIYTLLEDLVAVGNTASGNNKTFVLWGSSIGKFGQKYLPLIKNNLDNATLLFPREEISYENILKMGINKSKVHLIADPAFYMDYDPNVMLNRNKKEEIIIGINVSLLAVKHSFSNELEGETKLFSSLDSLLENNENIRFLCIPHVMTDLEGPQDDYYFMSNYIKQSVFKDRISILEKEIGAMKTKGFISKCDMIIAARMHCCVAGISSGTPTLFLTYSHKGEGMAKYAYDNENYSIKINDLNSSVLKHKVNDILINKSSIRESLKKKNPIFRKDAARSVIKLRDHYSKSL